MNDYWMQTYTGRQYFYGETDQINEITLLDISKSLSRQFRFLGHTSSPLSVAEHSVVVAEIVREEGGNERQQLYGLLHDAHEAYLGDIIRPLKMFWIEEYKVSIRGLEAQVQADIYRGLGIPEPEPVELHLVEKADTIALAAERRLFARGPYPWGIDSVEVPEYVLGSYGNWEPDEAARYFEKCYDRLLSAAKFESRLASTG